MTQERPCPACGTTLPSAFGYPDWCADCDWNLLAPVGRAVGGGRFARLTATLGRRSGERLSAELAAADELRQRTTPARVAAYAIAASVHLLTLALFAGGIAAIVLEFRTVSSIVAGVAMLAAAVVIRPRRAPFPIGVRVDGAEAPALHALAARVAAALGRPAPDAIVADARWNASWANAGRQRVLVLGVPLFAALEPRERVALIAHELGHDRNGDVARGAFIGSAIRGLDALSALLQPPRDAAPGAVEWITSGLLWVLTRPIDALLWIEARLLLRDLQRAEYLADANAADVAGTDAVIALHERLLLGATFEHAVQQAAVADDARGAVARIREAVRAVPDRELQRRRRVARLEHTRLEDSHPPTASRIALLETRAPRAAAVTLDAAESAAIDAELARFAPEVGRALVDRYRGSLG